MVSERLEASTGSAPLPIWTTVADSYRHLFRHRWIYLGQLFIWTVLLWIVEFPMRILQALVEWAEIDWIVAGTSLVNTLIFFTVLILCLLAGGGLMFLSCGRAIMSGRKPHISDALRLHRMGSFWRHLGIYWLIVNLVPTVVVQGLRIYLGIYDIREDWPGYWSLLALYWAWAAAAAPAIVLALPIAAFELHEAPIREGWRRLHGNRLRLVALSVLAALPMAILKMAHELVFPLLQDLFRSHDLPALLNLLAYWLLEAVLRGMLNLLVILVLGAAVICAYSRLAPRFDHLARVFD
jgi:hypothetical protein